MTSLPRARRTLVAALTGLIGAHLAAGDAGAGQPHKLLPPASGIYHAAFPDFGPEEDIVTSRRLRSFVSDLAGKRIAWAYFSDNWFRGIRFPSSAAELISGSGALPFIRMMPRADWREGCAGRKYSMQSILDGRHDRALRRYARDAAAFDRPLVIEFGTEVNGDWFPWSGVCNGGGETRGYGSPDLADGPERFRDAYRRIIDMFRAEGADNVTWVLHLDAYSAPGARWNRFSAYYPGGDYIDWIGVSAYGAQSTAELSSWNPSFIQVLDDAYDELASVDHDKPIAVLEFGVVQHSAMGEWIGDALGAIRSGRYPRVKAVSYWHSDWPNGDGSWTRMRLDSTSAGLSAYRDIVADPVFVSEPRLTP